MKIGLFNSEVNYSDLDKVFAFVAEMGCTAMQFDFISLYGESVPEYIDPKVIEKIHTLSVCYQISIDAIAGTYNMIHPLPIYHETYLRRFRNLARICAELKVPMLTLCTGTRNTEFMWSWHSENASVSAWNVLHQEMERVLEIADEFDINLGIECEATNVVSNPDRARMLLDDMNSSRLGIILDGANLFEMKNVNKERARYTLERAFDLLGSDIVMAHGKDIKSGIGLDFCAAGQGVVDFEYMCKRLHENGFTGSMILHGIQNQSDFPASIQYIKNIIQQR